MRTIALRAGETGPELVLVTDACAHTITLTPAEVAYLARGATDLAADIIQHGVRRVFPTEGTD